MSKRSCHRDDHLFDLQNRNGIAQRFSGTDLQQGLIRARDCTAKEKKNFSSPCSKNALNLKRSDLPREASTKTSKAKFVARFLALG